MTAVPYRRITHRIHEWLADHCRWIQYPRQQFIPRPTAAAKRSLAERALIWFVAFWLSLMALSIYGNFIT